MLDTLLRLTKVKQFLTFQEHNYIPVLQGMMKTNMWPETIASNSITPWLIFPIERLKK